MLAVGTHSPLLPSSERSAEERCGKALHPRTEEVQAAAAWLQHHQHTVLERNFTLSAPPAQPWLVRGPEWSLYCLSRELA